MDVHTSVFLKFVEPQMKQFHECYKMIQDTVTVIFKDRVKAHRWMQTPNPNFGSISPADMILNGCFDKLNIFVQDALEAHVKRVVDIFSQDD